MIRNVLSFLWALNLCLMYRMSIKFCPIYLVYLLNKMDKPFWTYNIWRTISDDIVTYERKWSLSFRANTREKMTCQLIENLAELNTWNVKSRDCREYSDACARLKGLQATANLSKEYTVWMVDIVTVTSKIKI